MKRVSEEVKKALNGNQPMQNFPDEVSAVLKMFVDTHREWVQGIHYTSTTSDKRQPSIFLYTKEGLRDLANHIGSKGEHQRACGLDKVTKSLQSI